MFCDLNFDYIFVGNFIHCPKEFSFEVLPDSYLATKGSQVSLAIRKYLIT